MPQALVFRSCAAFHCFDCSHGKVRVFLAEPNPNFSRRFKKNPNPACLLYSTPTSAIRPWERTLLSACGPCLSGASWTALHPASVPSNKPDWASMVLSTFPERKVDRPPGRTPAFIMIKISYLLSLSQIRGGWGFDGFASEGHQDSVGNDFADP